MLNKLLKSQELKLNFLVVRIKNMARRLRVDVLVKFVNKIVKRVEPNIKRTLNGKYGKPIILITTTLLFVSITFGIVSLINNDKARVRPDWWDETYVYRTPITFGNTGSAETYQKIKVDIDTATLIAAGQMQDDCGNSRFTDANGIELKYYIDTATEGCNGSSTDYYILVPSIVSGENLIYHYYGNISATNGTTNSNFSETTFTPTSGPTQGTEAVGPGPVALLLFDEASGTTVFDTTPQNNDGVLSPTADLQEQINIIDQTYTTTTTSSTAPSDNSLGIVNFDGTKYTGDTAYFEAVIANLDADKQAGRVGIQAEVDCPTADNCKIAYYDYGNSAIMFMDCDNAACDVGTITILDGHTGCEITGCETDSSPVDSAIGFDCVGGSDNCKISYAGGDDLYFIDCDNETCSEGTRNLVDGAVGCPLTGCLTTTGHSSDVSMDCHTDATDCKISYYNGLDLRFADCDNGTCTAGTARTLDGAASGNTLTGAANKVTGLYSSIDCSAGADDCKITYFDDTNNDISFADCGDETCSTGITRILDGTAGCVLTGCDTGVYMRSSLDCKSDTVNGADCKVIYQGFDNNDLFLGDCGDETCSIGTRTLLDGNTGCALSNCDATGNVGYRPDIDCTGGGSDCKISYAAFTNSVAYMVDCDAANCDGEASTRYEVDGYTSCGLTGCITGSAVNTSDTSINCSLGATDCKVLYNITAINEDLRFADCGDATCSTGTASYIDGELTDKDLGDYLDIYCDNAGTNCKMVYYDTTSSALRFRDCDDADCTTGRTVVLDGDTGCTATGCEEAATTGVMPVIDCSQGSDNCKVLYYENSGSGYDLMFIDCDSETCNVATRTILDGSAGCTLTGCSTNTSYTGENSLDCSNGGADCKFSVYRGGSDLYMGDCNTETCSTGTISLIDGAASCTFATGCNNTDNVGDVSDIDCSNGTDDCKIAYRNVTDTDLYLADCANAACTAGTITFLDGNTGCTLSGCGANISAGTTIALDCSAGTDDCKLTYQDATNVDLYFADCGDATCTTNSTRTLIDGNTGCALTGCTTSGNFGSYLDLDCNNGSADCKIAYVGGSSDTKLADCNNALCTEGYVTLLDGAASCTLTDCDTGLQTARIKLSCLAGSSNCKVAYSSTLNYYVADCNNSVCSTGNVANPEPTGDNEYVWAQLYTDAGTAVADGILMSNSSTYERVRSGPITLTDGEDYSVRIRSSVETLMTVGVQSAKIIVDQSSGTFIDDSQHQIEVGTAQNNFANTTYATLTDSPIYLYDADQFSGTKTAYFEATIHADSSSDTVSAQLLACTSSTDCSGGSAVGSSEVTHTGDTLWTRVRSNEITLVDGTNYAVQIKTSAGTADIANAKIIIDQDGSGAGLSLTEVVHPFFTSVKTDADATYSALNYNNYYDAELFARVSPTQYFESTIKTSAGTGYAQLYLSSTTTPVGSSEVSTTGTAYSRQRSSAITASLPSTGADLDVFAKNSATNTTSLASASLINQITLGEDPTANWKGSGSCYDNGCFYLNGTSQFVSLTNDSSIDFDAFLADGFTVGIWVKALSDGENNVGEIFQKGTNTYIRTTNEGSDGYVDLEAKFDLGTTDATVTVTNGLKLNTWQYVSLAYTNDADDEISLYVDGRRRGSSINGDGSPATDDNYLLLGGSAAANFHGYLDNFVLYPYERTAAEMKVDFNNRASVNIAQKDHSLSEGLVAYWNMDETSWTNDCSTEAIFDSSGYSNHGSACPNTTGPTNSGGKFGGGATFDGVTDYERFDVANNSVLNISNEVSISAWVNIDATTIGWNHTIVAKGDGTNLNYELYAREDASALYPRFIFSDAGVNYHEWQGSTSFAQDTWHHVVVTFKFQDPNSIKMYVDGSEVSGSWTSGTGAAAPYTGSDNLVIGTFTGNPGFNGVMDEVKVFNKVLTSGEVVNLYEYIPGPIAYWTFDEGSGNASDKSGNGLTLTNNNNTGYVVGKFGNAANISNSSTNYFSTSDNATLSQTGSMTVESWIKPTSVDASNVYSIVGKWSGTNESYLLAQAGDEIRFYVDSESNYETTDAANLAVGTWYHVTAVYTASAQTVDIYINGLLQASTTTGTIPTSIGDDASTFYIGSNVQTTNSSFTSSVAAATEDAEMTNTSFSNTSVAPALGKSSGAVRDASYLFKNISGLGGATIDTSYLRVYTNAVLAAPGGNMRVAAVDEESPAMPASAADWTADLAVRTTAYSADWLIPDADGFTNSPTIVPVIQELADSHDPTNILIYLTSEPSSGTQATRSLTYDNNTAYAAQLYVAYHVVGTYDGAIDEVKIYNYPRTTAQIVQDMNGGHPAPGSPVGSPIVNYRLDETGDLAGNSGSGGSTYNGNLAGSGTSCPSTADNACPTRTQSGKFGNALTFSTGGVDDYVDLGDMTFTEGADQVTWSFWAKPTTIEVSKSIFAKGNGSAVTEESWSFATSSVTGIRLVILVPTTTTDPNPYGYVDDVFTADEWTHIVGVFDGTQADNAGRLKVYINGLLANTQFVGTLPASLQATTSNARIGTASDGAAGYNGSVDEVQIFDTVLTIEQVKQLYNQSKAVVWGSTGTTATGTPSFDSSRSYCPPGDTSASCAPDLHYTFDEKSGTSAYDSTGNNYTCAFQSAVTQSDWVVGKVGGAFRFDAQGADNQDVCIFNWDQAADVTGSIEHWIYLPSGFSTSSSVDITYIVNNATGTVEGEWTNKFQNSNGSLQSQIVDGALATQTYNSNKTSWAAGWYHIAYTWGGSSLYLYINGILDSVFAADYKILALDSSIVLGEPTVDNATSYLDEFKIYDYTRTPAQVAWSYSEGAPTVEYRFDECSGTTLNNASPYGGNNATITPATNVNTAAGTCSSGTSTEMWNNGTTGKYSASLDFDGDDDYASTANGVILSRATTTYTDASWGGWFKPATTPASDTLIHKNNEFRLTTDASGNPQCEIYSTTWQTALVATKSLPTGTWSHVICTYDGTDLKMYINGVSAATPLAESDAIISSSASGLNIARDSAGSGYFDGQIDNVKIWSYPLTEAQIKLDYGRGAVYFGQ